MYNTTVPRRSRSNPYDRGRYRLQLGLGAGGLGGCALVLAAGVSSVHVPPHSPSARRSCYAEAMRAAMIRSHSKAPLVDQVSVPRLCAARQ